MFENAFRGLQGRFKIPFNIIAGNNHQLSLFLYPRVTKGIGIFKVNKIYKIRIWE